MLKSMRCEECKPLHFQRIMSKQFTGISTNARQATIVHVGFDIVAYFVRVSPVQGNQC